MFEVLKKKMPRRGQITAPILGLILLAIAVIIVTTITFVGLSIGASTAGSTLESLNSVTNDTVKQAFTSAVVQTSGVYGDYVQYLPLVIVVLLLTLIISALVGVIFMFFGAFGAGRGGQGEGGAM